MAADGWSGLVCGEGVAESDGVGLEWGDVDVEEGELSISRQLQRVGRQLLHRETKTSASDAMLPLPEICLAALDLRRRAQDRERLSAGELWHPSDLVFTTRYGGPVEPRNFNREFAACIVKADVPYITVHDARRTCASLLVDLDVHPRVVMQILRHAQFAVTMEIYSKVSSKRTRDALKRLGAILGDSGSG
ncbi:tyrosine-type recombinase/integrase [Actinopolymorpha singaporensis]|uniref:tyrosine-type recombinase/integrase n=1 Tax=Actinopolymorpha singaporensis TaxID=117157 RepID=UPI000AF46B87|nr:tyrosine-type recombinase/integrase [Actinopolymorpha singaporensis]